MKEELTTKEHNSFQITLATEFKHKAFTALEMIDCGLPIEEAAVVFDIPVEMIQAFEKDYRALLNASE
jgi:hypothetical protein